MISPSEIFDQQAKFVRVRAFLTLGAALLAMGLLAGGCDLFGSNNGLPSPPDRPDSSGVAPQQQAFSNPARVPKD